MSSARNHKKRVDERKMRLRRCREALRELFAALIDYRDVRRIQYALEDLLMLYLAGILWGGHDAVSVAKRLNKRRKAICRALGWKGPLPSHDTFSRMLRLLDDKELNSCLMYHAQVAARDYGDFRVLHLRIDGKALRAAHDTSSGDRVPYVLNALITQFSLITGVLRIPDKTNEIRMLPEILSMLDLRGIVVTCDAIGCQKETVEKIIAGGGDFCIPTKGNQKDLVSDAALMVESDIAKGKALCHSTLDVDRRIERRTYYISHLGEDESLPGWPLVRAVGKVHRRVQTLVDGKYVPSEDITYFICSRHFSELEFEQAVRGHWSVESFHHIQDEVFREDRSRARRGNAVANTAILNRLAYNILSVERKRRSDEPAAWEDLIFHFIVTPKQTFELFTRPFFCFC